MKSINGELFKKMIICGANVLHNHHPEIDALNVFPVPDGDTGTNMSLTFSSGAKDIENMETTDIYEVSKRLSKGLLMGARGNSGVILSQIFRGISMGFEGKQEVDAIALAQALSNGAKVAYKAVMRPVEGTILTVIRESTEKALAYVTEGMDIEELFSYFVSCAEESLEHTPELLPVLKEVGVVDSGGAGLLLVLTGFLAALAGDEVERVDIQTASQQMESVAGVDSDGEEGYGYCTEFIVRLDPTKISKFKEENLKKELSRIPGESIVVVQDEDIVKVHVHTLKPGNALNIAQRFGEFVKLKIENMQEQHNSLIEMETSKPVELKEVAIVSVAAGDGVKAMFEELQCDHVVSGGQTMNPSTEDIVQAIRDVHAKKVIILPNNSNIVMTAQQASSILEGEIEVVVIPSKTIPQGLSACIMYNKEASFETNIEEMNEAIKNVKTGQVTFAIKDTNIDGIDIKANEYMALVEKDIIECCPNRQDAIKKVIDKLIEEDSEIVTLIAGEDVQEEDLDDIVSYIEEHYEVEVEATMGLQPVYSYIVGVE